MSYQEKRASLSVKEKKEQEILASREQATKARTDVKTFVLEIWHETDARIRLVEVKMLNSKHSQ